MAALLVRADGFVYSDGGRGRGLSVFSGLCVDMWQLVHQWSLLLFWLSFDCFDDWYSVPFVKNSQKTVKQRKMTIGVPIVTYLHRVHTKPRKRRYLARPASHVPGQWPQPVARDQGWLYVSAWTSMRLAPVRCRVLLHSLLPTDDACSSSSLSTTVIKFSIFSDATRKLSALPPELRRIR